MCHVASNAPVRPHLGEVPDAFEKAIGDTRRSPRAPGDFEGSRLVNRRVEKAGGAEHDLGQLLGGIEVQVVLKSEAIQKGCAQHARSRRGAGKRERLERDLDGSGVRPLAQDKIHAEILHRRVEKLLDGARKPVNLVHEKDASAIQVGENTHQRILALQSRAR